MYGETGILIFTIEKKTIKRTLCHDYSVFNVQVTTHFALPKVL